MQQLTLDLFGSDALHEGPENEQVIPGVDAYLEALDDARHAPGSITHDYACDTVRNSAGGAELPARP